MMSLGPIGTQISNILLAHFEPAMLDVIDESNQHHGHSGAHPSGESHFRVRIGSKKLDGLARVQQHRAINQALAELLKSRVHALTIEVVRPG